MITLAAWRFSLLGYPAAFGRPHWLFLIALAVAIGAVTLLIALRRRRNVERLLSPRLSERLAPGVSVWRPAAQAVMTGLALVLFSIALAQPQCGGQSELVKKRGIDLVVALDASKSMLARDVPPNRLDRAKLELGTLLDQLKGDRVGLVAFAGDAFIQSPLTNDYSAAKLFLRAVDPLQMPQGGTNIGAALALSRQLLEGADRGAKERVILLLSDGEDLTGELDAALTALSAASIRVLTVGIGSHTGEPIPRVDRSGTFVDWIRDEHGQTVITRLDERGLQRIAHDTRGAYFHQANGVAMQAVLEEIDALQKSELESRMMVNYVERHQLFVFPALLLLLVAMTLRSSTRRAVSSAAGLILCAAVFSASPARALGPLEDNPAKVKEGLSLYREGRHAEALEAFDAALAEHPNRPELIYDRALALARVGRTDDAKAAFQQLVETGPKALQGQAAFNLGNLHAQASERKEAIAAYRKALKVDPNDRAARHNLELVLRNLPPPEPPTGQDAGAPDGGPPQQDGGPDAGEDGGVRGDAGEPRDGGSGDGGEGDGGSPGDGGTGDGGADGGDQGAGDGGADGGAGDAGADGGEGRPDDSGDAGEPDSRGDGGVDGGSGAAGADAGRDAGTERDTPASLTPDGGLAEEDLDKREAERLLDAMKQNEKNLQLWRFQQKKRPRDPNAKDW